MKAFTIHDFSVLIGLDWADQKHDICELTPDNDQPVLLSDFTLCAQNKLE